MTHYLTVITTRIWKEMKPFLTISITIIMTAWKEMSHCTTLRKLLPELTTTIVTTWIWMAMTHYLTITTRIWKAMKLLLTITTRIWKAMKPFLAIWITIIMTAWKEMSRRTTLLRELLPEVTTAIVTTTITMMMMPN